MEYRLTLLTSNGSWSQNYKTEREVVEAFVSFITMSLSIKNLKEAFIFYKEGDTWHEKGYYTA
jgi:hypothetical protein